MELAGLKYPNIRTQMIVYAGILADKKKQRETWKVRTGDTFPTNDMDFVIHFFYDDTRLNEDVEGAIGEFLKGDVEAGLVRDLIAAMNRIFDKYGFELADSDYLDLPEWDEVVARAATLKTALEA